MVYTALGAAHHNKLTIYYMQKSHNLYLAIIALLILVLAIRECRHRPEVIDHYNYTTDTTYSKKVYEEMVTRLKGIEKQLVKTPPKEVIYYPVDNLKEVVIEKIPDSILVYIRDINNENDSLRIAITDKYIKHYPTADKLIDFKLASKQMDITTLNIKGELKEATYPLYLDQYEYYWVDNNLSHRRVKQKAESSAGQWNQLYFNVGYEFMTNRPEIGIDYNKTFGKFRVRLATDITLEENPDLKGRVILGYRLFR